MNKYASLLSLLLLFASMACNKRSTIPSGPTDANQMVSAHLFGQVIDEAGNPVIGAVVRTGSATCITDADGAFQFIGMTTPRNRTVIEVSKENYFKGFRTLYILSNQDNYSLIRLIEKKNPAQFNAKDGGTIPVHGGGSIAFPPNAIVNKNTGAVYTGLVSAYTTWIDPSSSTLGELMPGALRGLDSNSEEKRLESYGMIGAELFDDQGQALQIAPGNLAELTFPIPLSLASHAAASIPLWYFDETNGLWKEQGVAQQQGTQYVGQVSHFSFWNCDHPTDFVSFEATIKNSNGTPIANVKVKVTNTDNSTFGIEYTNSFGRVAGSVPRGANLRLEVIIGTCEDILYTLPFTSGSSPIVMNTIMVDLPPSKSVLLAGKVLNCTYGISKNSYVKCKSDHAVRFIKSSDNGNFYSCLVECVTPLQVTLTAYDPDALAAGSELSFTLNQGLNTVGNLIACGNLPDQFVRWESTINGVKSSFSITNVTGLFEAGITHDFGPVINGVTAGDSSGMLGIAFAFDGAASTSGNHYLKLYGDHLDSDVINDTSFSYVNTIIPITLFRYDTIGGKLEGSFEGNIKGLLIPDRKVKCTFRMNRTH